MGSSGLRPPLVPPPRPPMPPRPPAVPAGVATGSPADTLSANPSPRPKENKVWRETPQLRPMPVMVPPRFPPPPPPPHAEQLATASDREASILLAVKLKLVVSSLMRVLQNRLTHK